MNFNWLNTSIACCMLLVFSFQIKMFAFKINLTVKDNIKNMFLQWFKGYATLMDVVINELYCAIFLSVCVFGVGHTVFYTIYICTVIG